MRNQLPGSRQSNSPVRAAAELARLLFRFRQQTAELIFPQRRDGVAAVTTGFLTQGNYQRATMWNAFDFAFENSELGWIDQIIRGIDRKQWRANFLQVWTGIVIARRVQCVEDIVGIVGLHNVGDEFVQNFIRFREGGCFFLSQRWVAAHEPKHFGGGAQTRRLRFVFATAPSRIIADGIDDDATPGAVPP